MMNTTPPPVVDPIASAPGVALFTLLAKFREEARRRGSHGRDFILGCLERVAELWRDLVRRCSSKAEEVAHEIDEAEAQFEAIVADGVVTAEERMAYRATLTRPKHHASALAQTLRASCER